MKRVFICSPYRADTDEELQANLVYARELCHVALRNDYAPFAPHLIYTQFLDDNDPVERSEGVRAGCIFMQACQELWFGTKRGLSEGMKFEIDHAIKWLGIPIFGVAFSHSGMVKTPMKQTKRWLTAHTNDKICRGVEVYSVK